MSDNRNRLGRGGFFMSISNHLDILIYKIYAFAKRFSALIITDLT